MKSDALLTLPEKRDSLTPISGKDLINNLSFTHICELLSIEDEVKRAFYEVEVIQGNWSVRELRRQVNSLYYSNPGSTMKLSKSLALTGRGI